MQKEPWSAVPQPEVSCQHTLLLVSHAHARPLPDPPDLRYDLRKLPNPPKHIRDAYDGRSKRLREHMLHEDAFTKLLSTAEVEITEKMIQSPVLRDSMLATAHSSDNAGPSHVSEKSTPNDGTSVQVTVSCFCERGKHRSVAFVEELSRIHWPREWTVEVHHRDVDQDRKKPQHSRGKKHHSTRAGKGFIELESD